MLLCIDNNTPCYCSNTGTGTGWSQYNQLKIVVQGDNSWNMTVDGGLSVSTSTNCTTARTFSKGLAGFGIDVYLNGMPYSAKGGANIMGSVSTNNVNWVSNYASPADCSTKFNDGSWGPAIPAALKATSLEFAVTVTPVWNQSCVSLSTTSVTNPVTQYFKLVISANTIYWCAYATSTVGVTKGKKFKVCCA